ncbi:MAG: Gfo/Idh/MocA family oxidoreductase [Gemmataceae bacterium]
MKRATLTRRQAVQGMAAVLGAPLFVPASALGRAGKPAASERVTLGHIGVGNQGRHLFRSLQGCKGAQSVAIADAYKDRREAMAAQCGGKAYADFRELLDRKDIDAVVIATPDHWHVPMAIYAARAGKDAYVEKPLGISIEQDLLCRKVFADKGRVFQYGTQQRSSEHCRLGCELVRNGVLGKIHTIEVTAPNGGTGGSIAEAPIPPTLDYDAWLGPAPRKPYTVHRCNPNGTYWIYDYSIGYLGGWGAHPLDILVWASDDDLSGPLTVEGTGIVPDKGLYDTVYNWDMKIQLANGVKMTFKPGGDLTQFYGERGWIAISRGGLRAEPASLLRTPLAGKATRLIASTNHYQNYVDAVKSRKPTVSPLTDAVRSDVLSHLCDLAVRLKRKITWDPKAEVVVNDAEATRLLHRPMRAPWTL